MCDTTAATPSQAELLVWLLEKLCRLWHSAQTLNASTRTSQNGELDMMLTLSGQRCNAVQCSAMEFRTASVARPSNTANAFPIPFCPPPHPTGNRGSHDSSTPRLELCEFSCLMQNLHEADEASSSALQMDVIV